MAGQALERDPAFLTMVQSPPIPRDVSAARTREALTDAALSLFARTGFDATATDQKFRSLPELVR